MLFLLLLLSLYTPPIAAAQTWTPPLALLALRAQWRDPHNSLADWTTASSYCSWKGVACRNASVVALSLSRLRLEGNLSSTIQYLPYLQTLDLSNNKFVGSIPSQIGLLASLSTLDLSHNGFSGELPGDSLGNLSLLVTLNLAFNQLQGSIPPRLGSLLSLQYLGLRHNLLGGSIPRNLSEANSLRYVLLENNTLSGEIPAGIGLLPHLKYLAVEHNSLTGAIPPDWVNLRGISAIYAGWNQLNGTIPQQIGNLRRLIHLQLQENRLDGTLPTSISALAQLRDLVLSNNRISGSLPPELGELKNLTLLDLSYNNLSGSVPAEIGNLSLLQNLDLQQNNLSGTITPYLGNLSSLQSLNLSYNNLSGEVPVNGVLSNLSASSFEGNPFLCGGPLVTLRCSSPPPASPPSARSYPRNDSPFPSRNKSHRISRNTIIIISVMAGTLGLALFALLLVYFLYRRKEPVQSQPRFSPELVDSVPNSKMVMHLRNFRFSYEEIVSQAGYYDTAHVLGKGRFATVYRSNLQGGIQLAVKVFKNPISQSTFERQIEQLEILQCRTLLPIRGFYSNPVEKVIFYDIMPGGTLYDLLHGLDKDSEFVHSANWTQRMGIAFGTAQALTYLHRGSNLHLLHGDLKSTNVLLSHDLTPFVSDYGLVGLVSGKSPFVETPGYTPPELRSTRRYSEKTDVYSFGVVLLELLTGKKPVTYIGDRELNLVSWVTRLQTDGRGNEVLEPLVVETCPFPDDYPAKALKLAILCLSEQPSLRPHMSEVSAILENLGGNSSPVRSPGPRADKPLLMPSEPKTEG